MKGGYPMRPDIIPGGIFPDYALPDHLGTVRKLSELQGRDPLVLTLARGDYSKFHGWDRRSPGSMPDSYVEPGQA